MHLRRTTDHRTGKTQQHMLESLQIKEEPHLGIQKPVKGNNMPLWRMNESLIWRMNEPLIWRMIEPLRRMNEVHSSSKSSEIDCINTHQNQAEYSCLFLRLRMLNRSTLHKIRSLRLTECYICYVLCFTLYFLQSPVCSLQSAFVRHRLKPHICMAAKTGQNTLTYIQADMTI